MLSSCNCVPQKGSIIANEWLGIGCAAANFVISVVEFIAPATHGERAFVAERLQYQDRVPVS